MREDLRISGRGAVPGWHRVPAFVLRRGEGEEGRRRKQEKGNASQALLSVCLHIVFLRDMLLGERDTFLTIGRNPPFLTRDREIWGGP